MKYIFSLLLISLLLVGCGPKLVCESPSAVIDGRCCLDANDNMVCDSDESPVAEDMGPLDKVVEPEPEMVEPAPEPAPVTAEVVKEVEPVEPELKAGTFNIAVGESRKSIELLDLKMHRYSTDKIALDYMWYIVRNTGGKDLHPEVRIRVEGIRRANQEGDGTTSQEFTYDLDAIKPGKKDVFKLALDVRFGQINKSRDITLEVYERFVAPKEVKGRDVYSFVPYDKLDTAEIYWIEN